MKKWLVSTGVWLKDIEYRLIAFFSIGALRLARRFDPDKALNFVDRAARRLGPWTPRHRVAVDNLRLAFPEKSDADIQEIALDMWGNMGRLAVEYVFLDRLFDYKFGGPVGRVEVAGIETFLQMRDDPHPRILVTGHMGNFELLATAVQSYDVEMTALFRPPNNPYIAREILSLRKMAMSNLLPSRAGVAFTLSRILSRGGVIGALVDQKFNRGIRNTFFGRECDTSPLVPRLARQHDAHLYAAHCIRLPGNRYRLTVEPKIEPARDAAGQIDAVRLAQQLNDIVEDWVRANPGQWMWFHKRWDMRKSGAGRPAAGTQ